VTNLPADNHTRLSTWLNPQPREKMLVYDRNGACLGRVKQVRSGSTGAVETLVVVAVGILASHKRERRLDAGHCNVRAGAVYTSYCLAQLDGQPLH
jgi:hypothetical protein